MKKNQMILIAIASIFSLAGMFVTIFAVPSTIPLLFDINENIAVTGSKAWLSIIIALPLIISLLSLFSKSKHSYFLCKIICILAIYVNVLVFIYLLTEITFEVGMVCSIPITCLIFLPLSLLVLAWGFALKTVPFNSYFGLKFRLARTTEFIWTQTHYFASKLISIAGLLLAVISIIFSMFHYAYIVLIIFGIILLIAILIIYINTYKMNKKYNEMKTRQENLQKKSKADN